MPDRAAVSFGKESDADFDDFQVPVAVADVEPCMQRETMSSRCTVTGRSGRPGTQADLPRRRIDGTLGE
jgi:hypothetical protein